MLFFFFQAEDGIRDPLVTGVQTCALPIWGSSATRSTRWRARMSALKSTPRPSRHSTPSAIPCRVRGRALSRSEEHTSELQSRVDLVCRLLLEKKKKKQKRRKARNHTDTPE